MNILFIINGGIAAYKVLDAIRYQMKKGNHVKVVMTEMAKQFITPLTVRTLTNNELYTSFDQKGNSPVLHVELANWSNKIVVAPATANFIAKMANGIADDFASTVILASNAPKLVLPAMNDHMWENEAVQRNLAILKKDGIKILDPSIGLLAEGYEAKGRFPDAKVVNAFIDEKKLILKGKNILITAGGTREPIDPVRFIGNKSSGKMGFALANVAADMGANVTLITGPSNQKIINSNIKRIDILSVDELQAKLNENIANVDVVIMAAAVSDYKVAHYSQNKIKKDKNSKELLLKLVQTPDLIANLKRPKSLKYVVGFAAETQNLEKNAQKKLQAKQLDMIVANNVADSTIGFNSNLNAVHIFTDDGSDIKLEKAPKVDIATKILELIAKKLN